MNLKTLQKYEKGGWVYSQVHPTLPLIIFNYSDATQYAGDMWDEVTLNARALVLDRNTGEVVSKGFPKFFNYSEGKTDIPKDIDWVRVYEKLDGSYIGLFYYRDDWVLNSRGSFTSDHVKWAEDILKDFDYSVLDKSLTYCFELIVPENRICVDYGEERGLYFLSAFCGGVEIDDIYPKELQETVIKFPKLMQLNNFSPDTLQGANKENEEGYVIKFYNGERCKIKFEEYVKLHSLYTHTSTRDIWKCLKDGEDLTKIIENAPDEIYDYIKVVKDDLEREYNKIAYKIMDRYNSIVSESPEITDKEFALLVKDNKYKSFLFSLRNGKPISQQIYKKIKPELKYFNNYECKDNSRTA